jgi:hypothetical protein
LSAYRIGVFLAASIPTRGAHAGRYDEIMKADGLFEVSADK